MLSVEQVLTQLIQTATPLTEIEQVDTLTAAGRVLARNVSAPINVPAFDNAVMDGYAVRVQDISQRGIALPVSQRIAAGQTGNSLQPKTIARIFTGAPIPPGANAVIMQEKCTEQGTAVLINHQPQAGEYIRVVGEDIAIGATVLTTGSRLRPQDCGLAASIGLDQLQVIRRLRVALMCTGDELTEPGQPLKQGAIYNSNRFVLLSALKQLGCEAIDLGIIPDNFEITKQTLTEAAGQYDLIITSGGVSVGVEDHIKTVIDLIGKIELWRIAVKPGKPLAFGRIYHEKGNTPILGLPGNPVSSFITFLIFARPFILRCQGRHGLQVQPIEMRADFNWAHPDGTRREYLRVCRNMAGGLDLYHNQASAVLSSAVWADGLVNNPPHQAIHRGDKVLYLPFSELLS